MNKAINHRTKVENIAIILLERYVSFTFDCQIRTITQWHVSCRNAKTQATVMSNAILITTYKE